jgi:hypothetical protein
MAWPVPRKQFFQQASAMQPVGLVGAHKNPPFSTGSAKGEF